MMYTGNKRPDCESRYRIIYSTRRSALVITKGFWSFWAILFAFGFEIQKSVM